MKRKMTITLSPSLSQGHSSQSIKFFEIFEGANKTASIPVETGYDFVNNNINSFDIVSLLDYYIYPANNIDISEGFAPIKSSDTLTVDIFKQEVEITKENVNGENQETINSLTNLELVAQNVTNFHIKDYKVSNGRTYQYFIYPSTNNEPLSQVSSVVSTGWRGWSLTELHPQDSSNKIFTVSPQDVWVFNLELDAGEQVQNIGREIQDTLGQFPSVTQGNKNYESGQISCYLGRDFFSASYLTENNISLQGYTEYVFGSKRISSNDKVDMLKQWRKVVFSNNPKLLKDRKGQMFLVTITASSNTVQSKIKIQPDLINFSWVEIGSLDGINIIGLE